MKNEWPDKKKSLFRWLAAAVILLIFNILITSISNVVSVANDSISLINGVCELTSRFFDNGDQTSPKIQHSKDIASAWNTEFGYDDLGWGSTKIKWDTEFGYDDSGWGSTKGNWAIGWDGSN